MKTAISLPDALFEAAERMAKRLDVSRSQLFQRAIQRYLDEHRKAGVTEALDKVYAEGPESGPSSSQVDPALDRLQRKSLEQEDW